MFMGHCCNDLMFCVAVNVKYWPFLWLFSFLFLHLFLFLGHTRRPSGRPYGMAHFGYWVPHPCSVLLTGSGTLWDTEEITRVHYRSAICKSNGIDCAITLSLFFLIIHFSFANFYIETNNFRFYDTPLMS